MVGSNTWMDVAHQGSQEATHTSELFPSLGLGLGGVPIHVQEAVGIARSDGTIPRAGNQVKCIGPASISGDNYKC
jgi:hypothetical protein